ncbi:glycosyltransferase [Tautonia rosea]|uniref:glycosyltransferase n=1 Tax=Tautonia rosea TaxID=2728037 RepID=UPI0028F45703|nr:glycosyltransferase [Tautonia rosea]
MSHDPSSVSIGFDPPVPSATICQILHGLEVGGAEVLAARLARQLQGEFRFVFVCLDELGTLGRALLEEGFPVHLVGREGGFDRRCTQRLAELFRRERIDLIHAHQYTPFFYGITARLLCRRPPVLFTEHGRWYPDYRRPKRIVANRILLERRDRVVGVGEAVRQALIRNEGIPGARVRVIYNGVDLAAFAEADTSREETRRELGLGPDDLAIVQVARLDGLKDHATAVRTMARVVTSQPEARLFLVGDGPEREPIRELIQGKGVESSVSLLGLRTDVPRLLSAADVAFLTSVSEGIPLTLIEAMGAGLPVVSTDVGGVGEVVEHSITGLLAPPGDDEALAGHLIRLAADPKTRHQMGMCGCNRACELFSERLMHDYYRQLYCEMLLGRRA